MEASVVGTRFLLNDFLVITRAKGITLVGILSPFVSQFVEKLLSTLLHAEVNGPADGLSQFLNADVAITIDIKHLEDIDDILVTDDKIVDTVEAPIELSEVDSSLVVLVYQLHPVESNVVDALLRGV